MPPHVCNGASLTCCFGFAPSVLTVLPVNRLLTSKQPAATIMDSKPIANIKSFGMCSSPANPLVLAATAAAGGVPTPAPCVPATAAPWLPGAPTVLVGKQPALNTTSKLMCSFGGVIQVLVPGQLTAMIP